MSTPRVAVYVGGSIAAYRACDVVSRLRQAGCEVRVAMTAAATRFVSPMTLQALAGSPVTTSVWDEAAGAAEQGDRHAMAHIGLSAWATVQVVVPASADLIARLALGLADDAVTATALACEAPLLVVPAMETRMWRHPATAQHVGTLRERGATVVGPVSGRLASGHSGEGRMAPVEEVVDAVLAAAAGGGDRWLEGRRAVVTAGGTREPIDPVRFLGNHSSGRMGAAIAAEAARLGAAVTLVMAGGSVPVTLPAGVTVVAVDTAAALDAAVRAALPGSALLVMAAAVADYRPLSPASRKLKKGDGGLTLELVPTVDVLASLRGDPVREGVVVVGFAAETDDLLANAQEKLQRKGLDLIVANDVSAPGIGMGSPDNAVTVIDRDGTRTSIGPAPKPEVARRLLALLRPRLAG